MNTEKTRERTKKLTMTAMLTAVVVVLQIVSSFVKFGPFSITLTLIPIAVGAILLGPKHGAALGAIFGIIVFIFCVNGVDTGGNILFNINPVLTALLCIFKGAAAGLVSALVYKALHKKSFTLAVILSAVVVPIINTGLFLVGMLVFFYDTLTAWAGGTAVGVYIITGLVGVNFLVEFLVTVVLSPTVASTVRNFSRINSEK